MTFTLPNEMDFGYFLGTLSDSSGFYFVNNGVLLTGSNKIKQNKTNQTNDSNHTVDPS